MRAPVPAQGVIHNQGVYAGIIDDESQFLGGQAKIQRHEDRAQGLGGKHGFQQRRMVEAQVTHPVADTDTARLEQRCLAPHAVAKFPVGDFLFLENQRRALGVEFRAAQRSSGEIGFLSGHAQVTP